MSAPSETARAGEAGVATVWALTWIVVLTTVAWIGMLAAAATARQHRVGSAADLAAVSAAAQLQRGGDACLTAAQIAVRNGVDLRSCRVVAADVLVEVSDDLQLAFAISRQLVGQARAGPRDGR